MFANITNASLGATAQLDESVKVSAEAVAKAAALERPALEAAAQLSHGQLSWTGRASWGGPHRPEHSDVAQSLENLAITYIEVREYARARVVLERAIAIFDAHDGLQFGESETRSWYAKVLAASGDERAARARATAAADGYREAGDEALAAPILVWIEARAG
ncbi:MAG: hypothetical protein K0V04_36305 [Deltaproteobacteria bacterium]|nr:hypothetical protein [Deltaproteobacteria bacterium]